MYRYIGGGAYLPGVPARDMLDEEYETIPEEYKAVAKKLYEKVEQEVVEDGDVQSD